MPFVRHARWPMLWLLSAACTASPIAEPGTSPVSYPTGSPTLAGASITAAANSAGSPILTIPDGPTRDPYDIARRYRGVQAVPLGAADLYPEEVAGRVKRFRIIAGPGPDFREAAAQLVHVSAGALWYVEHGQKWDPRVVERTARELDEVILPFMVAFTGTAPQGRLTILNASLSRLAGYFSKSDLLPQTVAPMSNERAMLYISTAVPMGSPAYMSTLTHELQHFLHHMQDPDEATWVHEGLAEFGTRAAGYPSLPVGSYLRSPGTSVLDWPDDMSDRLPSYAGSSLFMEFLAGQTGGLQQIHQLVAEPANGISGINSYLRSVAPGRSFRQVFADWAVANAVERAGTPYAYSRVATSASVQTSLAGSGRVDASIAQHGVWYAAVHPSDPLEVVFDGADKTSLLPDAPPSGRSCWWSNRGDEMNSKLTRTLDLKEVDGAVLEFALWYRLEEGFDFAYVAVSSDGGSRWKALGGLHTRMPDPSLRAYGPGYTGRSRGWVKERIDLSAYAGSTVLLRFELITDDSINGPGLCVDDITVRAIGFSDDAETSRGWQAEGFMLLPESVPQRFIVQLIRTPTSGAVVEQVGLDGLNRGSVSVMESAVLVVVALAPKTSEPAQFTVETRPMKG